MFLKLGFVYFAPAANKKLVEVGCEHTIGGKKS